MKSKIDSAFLKRNIVDLYLPLSTSSKMYLSNASSPIARFVSVNLIKLTLLSTCFGRTLSSEPDEANSILLFLMYTVYIVTINSEFTEFIFLPCF